MAKNANTANKPAQQALLANSTSSSATDPEVPQRFAAVALRQPFPNTGLQLNPTQWLQAWLGLSFLVLLVCVWFMRNMDTDEYRRYLNSVTGMVSSIGGAVACGLSIIAVVLAFLHCLSPGLIRAAAFLVIGVNILSLLLSLVWVGIMVVDGTPFLGDFTVTLNVFLVALVLQGSHIYVANKTRHAFLPVAAALLPTFQPTADTV